ncbi:MAG: hypothetical protein CL666_13685 [Balneola sp.]|nr:hypothetical protein [Balneola sp.]|tara:strand:+ start:4528 stop:4761 length:234 start_codon:yes stop_codon:yes gene_type:complete
MLNFWFFALPHFLLESSMPSAMGVFLIPFLLVPKILLQAFLLEFNTQVLATRPLFVSPLQGKGEDSRIIEQRNIERN